MLRNACVYVLPRVRRLVQVGDHHHLGTCAYSSGKPNKSGGSISYNTSTKNLDTTRGVLPKSVSLNLKSKSQWLKRQLSDPYVRQAHAQAYVSRAAFKLAEMDEKLKILKPGALVVDLGATPGGWTQVAQRTVGDTGVVISVDINEEGFELPHSHFIAGDFSLPETKLAIKAKIQEAQDERSPKKKLVLPTSSGNTVGFVDVVLSDMAPPYCGVSNIDHDRLMELANQALQFAIETLKPGGSFICKVSRGGTELRMLKHMERFFGTVKSMKPDASRQESTEIYYIGLKYRPVKDTSQSSGDNTGNNSGQSIYDD
ncbi:hypothetical protein SAMD00019534_065300 [Acytostelium subglobosum LB1]|uniref:hypothetical protein n=1 Tax=Acytostelium subglobosum LB1 TaxID=1410327 RepID=UPI0006450D88|nr:hypothetical protein SAMD00019534_065300 [Acytostelium subglobosum LB1]GAM23355.1 hypothetical protein SAMD00019534_065300 [Acytostelium subglobosum LB1]|eukprot:XP_012753804.1 hypothetical protein SAMD00019534_065300 [Acytostelium subglobosum LB1]